MGISSRTGTACCKMNTSMRVLVVIILFNCVDMNSLLGPGAKTFPLLENVTK